MYIKLREGMPAEGEPARRQRSSWWHVPGNVLALGFTSLITDISSEMLAAVLPLYFVIYLQLSPLVFGVIDGLYHGVAALVRIGSGIVTDRWHRYKEVAAAGYGLSAFAKLGLLAVGSVWTGVVGVILVDRVGKGIRTSPLLFLDGDGDTYRRIAASPLDEGSVPEDEDDGRLISDVRCQRFYFAAGRGLCVEADAMRGRVRPRRHLHAHP